jgi:hypothetical protein
MEQALFPETGGHETIRELSGFDNAFKFSFVRNPWDRFVSAFFCHPKNTSAKFLDGFSMDTDGFNEYIKFCASDYPGWFPMRSVYATHFLPMYHFLLNDGGEIGVDFVGRFETLQKDWEHVCNILGVSEALPHQRKSEKRSLSLPYQQYYTPESWDYVGELYWQDLLLFGYK